MAALFHGLDELSIVSGLVEAERDLHVGLLPQLDDLGASHQQAHYGVHHLKHSVQSISAVSYKSHPP